LSYYLDFQANESFLETAVGYDNIAKLGASLGYKASGSPAAIGTVAMYLSLPANSVGTGPNTDYLPIIRRGTTFIGSNGVTYSLIDDVIINSTNSEIRKSKINENSPFEYVVKTYGKVISGNLETFNVTIGDFQKFRKIQVGENDVTEVVSVFDSEGHEYYEVDYLTQNIIYRSVVNLNEDKNETQFLFKPFSVARRFVVVNEAGATYLQFGGASDDPVSDSQNKLLDPSTVVLDIYGKDYITDKTFDPSVLVSTDKLGTAPVNTILTITVRKNLPINNSAAANGVANVGTVILDYQNPENLDASVRFSIKRSMRVQNENPILGQTADSFTNDELKTKVYGSLSAQGRAVTEGDYKALCYNMPSKFGSIKRVKIARDMNELKRNLNLYVVSDNSFGELVNTNSTTKTNLKNWLAKNKMINDTIDILDAKIVNFGIYFTIMTDQNYSKYDVLTNALTAVKSEFSIKMDIGESVAISRIYEALRGVSGIVDVRDVFFTQKLPLTNSSYSPFSFNFDENLTPDGRFLKVPKNVIMEIKFPDADIEGKII
jgi:hypothetical protein